jgi:hypothetical protein
VSLCQSFQNKLTLLLKLRPYASDLLLQLLLFRRRMLPPVKNKLFADLDDAFIRLHNSGFTKEIFHVKE